MSASRGLSPTARAAGGAAEGALRCETAFAVLDEIVQVEEEHGVVTVVLGAESLSALSRHIERRGREIGRPTTVAGIEGRSEPWRELARRLDAFRTTEPIALARRMATVATGHIIVVGEHERSSWGLAVCEELGRLAIDPTLRLLLIVLHAGHGGDGRVAVGIPEHPAHVSLPQSGSGPRRVVLELERLTADDARRWWEATIAQSELLGTAGLDRLDALDSWWQAARALHGARPRATGAGRSAGVSPEAAALLSAAVRAEEPLTIDQLASLGPESARIELEAAGMLALGAGGLRYVASSPPEESPPSPATDRRVADVLSDASLAGDAGVDAWTAMRAAELYSAAGAAELGEKMALRAVGLVNDAAARDDLWRRWGRVLEHAAKCDGEPTAFVDRLTRSAARALELSDGERAEGFARHAMGLAAERFDVLVMRGKACTLRGDLPTAALVLERAIAIAMSPTEESQAACALAEVHYLAGRFERAAEQATAAAAVACDAASRLDARNTLGKLLLGRADFAAAELHFAEDAVDAARAHDVERELRARLNRAIAVYSLGRRDEARDMYGAVLTEGEACGSMRAVAFALSNLAVIAIADHAYERALLLSERAIEVRRGLGDRTGMVRSITNLAELRLRLGMIDEAEQTLRFGLQACGRELPASLLAHFALKAARIDLVRGDTVSAARQVGRARVGAAGSGDGNLLGECERVAARIALEDGDVRRARDALAAAWQRTPKADGHPELPLLAAMCSRAEGGPFGDDARTALLLGEQRGDVEICREAQLVLCQAARGTGDEDAAQRHLVGALGERDRVSAALPDGLRARYLARPDLAELAELEAERLPQPSVAAVPMGAQRAATLPALRGAREMIGQCPAMRTLRSLIERIAPTEATVLIHGETGTGKELVAEAIHRSSRRRGGPLVKVNCGALVETLLLSELFGHERGAFTGASARRRGRFELADGGTLFLDEIGDISARTQVALLRVLQEGTFERVGGSTTHKANVRVICATNRDLRSMVERGEFREDLYYRLCGVTLEVPALRERPGDLPLLAAALLERSDGTAGLEPKPLGREALAALGRHAWPGNVRELENALRVAALFARGPEIELSDFTTNVAGLRYLAERVQGTTRPGDADAEPATWQAGRTSGPAATPPDAPGANADSTEVAYAEIRAGVSLSDLKRRLEQECVARALSEAGGNITRAAALLGMKRPRLSQLVKQYQLGSALEEKTS